MAVARTPAPQPAAPAPAPAAAARPSVRPRLLNAPPAVRLSSDAGSPLPSNVQTRLERSFNYDLSGVRVHNDAQAATTAANIGARAFTYGSNIFLGAGQRASNLGLMAHETTHVIQQQAAPTVQMSSLFGEAGGSLEREAQQASLSVMSGQPVAVQGRTAPHIQGDWIPGFVRRGISAVGAGIRAVGSAIADVGAAAWNAAVNFFRERARAIPGYDLLAVILGRDPISQQPVERNAVNLIRGVVGLIPGGAQLFENLQRANVIQRAYDWVTGEIARLNLTWAMISGAFSRFMSSLGVSDLLNPGGVWERARAIFGEPISRLMAFATAAGRKVLELIFEGALALGGAAAQRVLGIFRRVGATFSIIANDPVRFLSNLINAVRGGFQQFRQNIIEHLRNALFQWLLGALAGAGLQLPQRFDLMGIISIVLQVLGLTYARMRERLVRLIGEPAVAFIERAFEFLRLIVTQGIAAAWQKLLEFASGLVDTVIDGIRNWVVRTIVGAAVTRLATMFNPVGAIINAIITIYNTVMFFIERAQQIAALVESIIDSVDNIARGNLGAAIAYVERTMARVLPVIISFLARLIGLGGISDAIKGIIQRIQAVVDRALDRVINWIRERAAGLMQQAGGNQTPEQRLEAATTAAQGVMSRFAGRRVGAVVIRPLLTVIRVQHRLTSLDIVPQGDRWAIEAVINPRRITATPALLEMQQAGTPGAPPAAPVAAATLDRLRAVLAEMNITQAGIPRVVDNLAAAGQPGVNIINILVNRTFAAAQNFREVVSQLQQPNMVITTYSVLVEATRVKDTTGIRVSNLNFEISEQVPGGYDVDFAVINRRGTASHIYQIKRIGVGNFRNQMNNAVGQLRPFQPGRRMVVLHITDVTQAVFRRDHEVFVEQFIQSNPRYIVDIVFLADGGSRLRFGR